MAELDRAAISVRLQQARVEAGLTQPELGEALSEPLHWRTIQNYERPSLPRIPWGILDEWARITGTTKEWLLHGDEAPLLGVQRLERMEALLERLTVAVETALGPLSPLSPEERVEAARAETRRLDEDLPEANPGAAARPP